MEGDKEERKKHLREYMRGYYKRNKQKIFQKNKRWIEKNREKVNRYHRERYRKNPNPSPTRYKVIDGKNKWIVTEKMKISVKRYHNRRKEKFNKWFIDYKKKLKCEKCGISGEEHPYILDFHHINGNKRFSIGKAGISYPKEEILKEIEKCIVVCANCHRIIQWNKKS